MPGEATVAAWAARQQALASRLSVPATELYGLREASPQSGVGGMATATVDRHGLHGCVDETFVHDAFLLPTDELTHIIRALQASSGGDPAQAALAAQLTHDLARQQEWVEHRAAASRGLGEVAGEASALVAPLLPALQPLKLIGGVDVSFVPGTHLGVACLAILAYPSLTLMRTFLHHCELTEPYLSGFLAFREVQPVRELFAQYGPEMAAAGLTPQLLYVDGCGVHHPRRCGLASHLGVELGIPTIGCAKKMLAVDGVGREDVEACFAAVAPVAASSAATDAPSVLVPALHPIVGKAAPHQLYGYALRTTGQSAKKLIYVSPGNRVGFGVAAALVMLVCRTRVPEPVRQADLCSRLYIRDGKHQASSHT